MPTHRALQQGLLSRLLGGTASFPMKRAAFGVERPHDFLETILRMQDLPMPRGSRGLMAAADVDGVQLLKAFRAYEPCNAPASMRNLMEFCRRHEVSVRFNDAALDDVFIDARDPSTRALMDDSCKKVTACGRDGVALRNRMMPQRALRHMRDTGAQVYVQTCGRAHLLGDTGRGFDFTNSLSARFMEANVDVLPVAIAAGEGDRMAFPDESEAVLRRGLIVKGLGARTFTIEDVRAEKKYLASVSARSGRDVALYPYGDEDSDWAVFKDVVLHWQQWTRRYEAAAQPSPQPAFA
jgi:hypothetical protein